MVLTILTAVTILIIVLWNGIQYRQMKRQLEIQNEQIKLNFFQDYANRATQLFWRLPENIYEDSFSFDDLDPEKRTDVMKTLRMLFDISSEWHFLYENQYVDERFWKMWEDAVPPMFNDTAFKIDRKKFKSDPTLSQGFRDYMDEILEGWSFWSHLSPVLRLGS